MHISNAEMNNKRPDGKNTRTYTLRPIGLIHSPYLTPSDAPSQGKNSDFLCYIEIFEDYKTGLRDIEGFSHLIILYWMHLSKHFDLLAQTPWDTKKHGLFSTRSPHRPNPIGLSVVRFIKKNDNILTIKGIDAIDNTPVLDIKPYIPSLDKKITCEIGWLTNKFR
jgi:formylmethanofuran dehydrogenase subunit E